MSVLTLAAPAVPIALPAPSSPPVPKRWTVDEFHQLWEDGWFEGCRPMLLDGEIFQMAIPGPLHNSGVGLADYALKAVFGASYWVRVQMPLVLGQWSDPIPDVAVLVGSVRDHGASQPTSAELVVEVADTSLAIDTSNKAELYAAAGIADYWVSDLNNRILIVHRDPRPDPASGSGSSYATVLRLTPGQTVSPLALPQSTINVADLLP
jgi:Uma2 family endonuclease